MADNYLETRRKEIMEEIRAAKKDKQDLVDKYDALKTKKDDWELYVALLEDLKTFVDDVASDLRSASTNFLNGGYVDNGKSLDGGSFETMATSYDGVSDDISTVITNTNTKIQEFSDELDTLNTNITNKQSYIDDLYRDYYNV